MSDRIEISNGAIFEHCWVPEEKCEISFVIDPDRILSKLRMECVIKPGTTLVGIFRAVEGYPLLKDFISQYSWCRQIDEFHAQAEEPMRTPGQQPGDGDMTHLQVDWVASYKEYKGDTDFDVHLNFHGIGKGETTYSVSCSPAYDLADCEVKLNTRVKVYKPWKEWKVVDGKRVPETILEGDRCFTLLDVLDAIYDDISFHGGPAENAEFIEEMNNTMAKIESGEIETTPFVFPEDEK